MTSRRESGTDEPFNQVVAAMSSAYGAYTCTATLMHAPGERAGTPTGDVPRSLPRRQYPLAAQLLNARLPIPPRATSSRTWATRWLLQACVLKHTRVLELAGQPMGARAIHAAAELTGEA